MYMLAQPRLKETPPYVWYKDVFTSDECAKIKLLATKLGAAHVGGNVVDPSIRSSEVHWEEWSPSSDWVYARLANLIGDIVTRWYPLNLSGFAEPLQITRYRAEAGGHYEMHRDYGPDAMSTRKLSLCCLLSAPEEFDGGEFEVLSMPGDNKVASEMVQGTVVAFPSYELHRVLPVTRGERWSAVGWVSGRPFC